MAFQSVFKRYELKYLVSQEQKEHLLSDICKHMELDRYGRASIRNIYYDTDTYLLIRRSIEKPIYKEKLRVRSYGKAKPEDKVFVELKKKYKHTVYKRRVAMREADAIRWLEREHCSDNPNQILNEIDYFISFYKTLRPAIFLSYDREAYKALDGKGFRVTFDENILGRTEDIALESEVYGTPLLKEDMVLMELKCSGAIPLWMVQALSREHIYKTSFSKYGTAYKTIIYPHRLEDRERIKGVSNG